LIIGSRASPLALRQTEIALAELSRAGVDALLCVVKTSGDLFLDRPLHQLSGQGVFCREIDEQMLSGKIDLAVHSMKDLPTKRPPELGIAAVLKRDSPFDILVSRDGSRLDELAAGAVVGTSSMRRSAQLRRERPDLRIANVRGNLQTRLRKLDEGGYDALILALAGLQRMGYDDMDYQVLDGERFVPSANQGTIAVVAMRDTIGEKAAGLIDHAPTRTETLAERAVMERVGGGCVVPMAVHAEHRGGGLRMVAEVLSLDGSRFVRVEEMIPADDYLRSAQELGKRLAEMGGADLVDEAVRAIGSR